MPARVSAGGGGKTKPALKKSRPAAPPADRRSLDEGSRREPTRYTPADGAQMRRNMRQRGFSVPDNPVDMPAHDNPDEGWQRLRDALDALHHMQGDWVDIPGRDTSPWGWSDEDWPKGYDESGGRSRPFMGDRRRSLDAPPYNPDPWEYLPNQNFDGDLWGQFQREARRQADERTVEDAIDQMRGGRVRPAGQHLRPDMHEAPAPPTEVPTGMLMDALQRGLGGGGNWLYGNDQSLLSYHPNLDPRVWIANAAPGPNPQTAGAAGGAVSLLDLLPYLLPA